MQVWTRPDIRSRDAGGLADFWCLGDGDIMGHPLLILPCLTAFDIASAEMEQKSIGSTQKSSTMLPRSKKLEQSDTSTRYECRRQ